MFSAMSVDAYPDEHPELCAACRADGHLNDRRRQTPTRLSATTVHYLHSVDNYALNILSEADPQRSRGLFASDCANIGLTIDTDKTVIMHQLSTSAVYSAPRIYIKNTQMEIVDNFAYLSSNFCVASKSTMKYLTTSPNLAEPSAGCKTPYGIVMIST
nr:unnamed protein product [Spirometra erinaceieuropaei]